LELYFAAPCTGRVLHTLNIRLFPEQVTYIANHAEDEVIFCDRSLTALLFPLLKTFETVRHVVVMDDGKGEIPTDSAGIELLRYEDLMTEAEPVEFRVDDENRAASMCYTSGTTGNPKGVVYSHRSSYLHTMANCTGNGLSISSSDCVIPIVPMFHANAWGLPYAALMAGADLVLPDCHLDAKSLIDMIEKLRPTVAGAVPTIWNDVMHCLEKDPDHDVSSLRVVACGGSAVPVSLM